MTRIIRIVNKPFNQELFLDELRASGLDIGGPTWVGFIHETEEKVIPKPERSAHATGTAGDKKTLFESDPGELYFRGDTDPGAALDALLAAHDFNGRSAGQLIKDAEGADKVIVEAELAKPGRLSDEGARAAARLALRV